MVSLISIYNAINCTLNFPTIWTWSIVYNYLEHHLLLWNKSLVSLSYTHTHTQIYVKSIKKRQIAQQEK